MSVSIPGQKASVGMKRVSRAGSAEATRGTSAAAPDPKGCTSTMGKIDDDEGRASGCVLAPQIDGPCNKPHIMAKFRLHWPGAERQQP